MFEEVEFEEEGNESSTKRTCIITETYPFSIKESKTTAELSRTSKYGEEVGARVREPQSRRRGRRNPGIRPHSLDSTASTCNQNCSKSTDSMSATADSARFSIPVSGVDRRDARPRFRRKCVAPSSNEKFHCYEISVSDLSLWLRSPKCDAVTSVSQTRVLARIDGQYPRKHAKWLIGFDQESRPYAPYHPT